MIEGTETVTLLPGVRVDKYDRPLPVEGDPVDVHDVVVSPGPAPESTTRDRDGVRVDLTLYMLEGTAVNRTQRVTVRGAEYEVVSEPKTWTGGSLTPGQVVVEVTRTEG